MFKRLFAKLGFRIPSWEGRSSIYDLKRRVKQGTATWPYGLKGELMNLSYPGVRGGDVVEFVDDTDGSLNVEIPKSLSKEVDIYSELAIEIKPADYSEKELEQIKREHLNQAEYIAINVDILNPEDKAEKQKARAALVKMNKYEEARSLAEVLSSLKDYVSQHFPDIADSFNPGASDEALDAFEQHLSVTLPSEFRELYRFADGQNPQATPLFDEGYQFLSLAESRQVWDMMKELDAGGEFDWCDDVDWGPIRGLWWHPKWIFFAQNIAGDDYCVDLNPSDSGRVGQVISFIHDDETRDHLGYSLKDFIGEYERGLRSGKYVLHKEYGVFVKNKRSV